MTALALLLHCALDLHAEVDERYDGGSQPALSEHERETVRRQIELAVEAERGRAVDDARREEAEARHLAAEREARPLAIKLLEARCRRCHDAERIAEARYGPVGWHATILRMQWLNGAALASGDRAAIARHLAQAQPASWAWQAAAWLMLLSPVAMLAAAVRWVIAARR